MTNNTSTANYPGLVGHHCERITLDTIITSDEVQFLLGKGETLRETFKRVHAERGAFHYQMNNYADRFQSARRTLAYGEDFTASEVYALYVEVVLDQADYECSEAMTAICNAHRDTGIWNAEAERKARDKASRARNAATKAAYGATYTEFVRTFRI